jgi:hypothetical protein
MTQWSHARLRCCQPWSLRRIQRTLQSSPRYLERSLLPCKPSVHPSDCPSVRSDLSIPSVRSDLSVPAVRPDLSVPSDRPFRSVRSNPSVDIRPIRSTVRCVRPTVRPWAWEGPWGPQDPHRRKNKQDNITVSSNIHETQKSRFKMIIKQTKSI